MIGRGSQLACLLLLLLAAGYAAPATAATPTGQVQVSPDGHTWTGQLDAALFEPSIRWVPGDQRIRSFFVRSRAATDGNLSLSVHTTSADAVLADEVVLEARVAGSHWRPVDAAGQTHLESLPAGTSSRIDLRAALPASVTNQARSRRLNLDLAVRLVESGDDTGAAGELPNTGAPMSPWQLALAAGLLGAGLALIARNRRGSEPTGEASHGQH